jgi:Flp pilus assembly protein TadB
MTTERSDVERARADLAETLEAIEYKLNFPKRTSERVQRLRKENPLALVGIAVGAAAAVAGVVWLAIRVGKN